MSLVLAALLTGAPASAAEGSAVEGPGAVIQAAEVVVEDGLVRGHGEVRALVDGEELTADSFVLDVESGRLEVHRGSWQRAQGTARFAQAVLQLEGGSAEVLQGSVRAEGVVVEGERLTWREDGSLQGEGLRLTTCGCARPPWEVQARSAVVVPDSHVSFQGGLVRIFGLPLLPVPAGRLALGERVSGLLPPKLGTGQDGVVVGLPAWFALGPSAELGVEAELRSARGSRLLTGGAWALEAGRGEVQLAGGWDWQDRVFRGAGSSTQGYSSGPWRLGLDAQLEGDRSYLADYGDAFLSRARPWGESLGVFGYGPLRLEHDGVQALDEEAAHGQRPVGLVLERAGQRLGPVAVDGLARIDLVGEGSDPWAVDPEPGLRWELAAGAEAGRELGLVRLEARTEARALAYQPDPAGVLGRVETRAWLPSWADLGAGRLVGEWGLVAAGAALGGNWQERQPWDEAPPAWSVGPALTGRLLTASGVPMSGAGTLAWTAEGWQPEGWLRADLDAWRLRLAGRRSVQEASLGYDDGVLALTTAAVRTAPDDQLSLLQQRVDGSWLLPGLRGLRPGYFAQLDVVGGQALSHGPRLGYSSPCGCLSLWAAAAWSKDREGPDLGLQLSLD